MSRQIFSTATAHFRKVTSQINTTNKPVSLIKHTGVIPGGFSYYAFDGAGKVRLEPIFSMRAYSSIRTFCKLSPDEESFLDMETMLVDNLPFIQASVLEVSDKLYDANLCKGPLFFDVELDHVKKSSFLLKTTMYLEEIKDPVISMKNSILMICSKTRTRAVLPDWWLKKFKSQIEGEGNPLGKLDFSGADDDARSTESQFVISPSDADMFRHTNYASYIKFCQNAFGLHQMSQGGKDGYEEYQRLHPRSVTVFYSKESTLGDVLTVKVRPIKSSLSDDVIFYFRVENQSKDILCQSRIE